MGAALRADISGMESMPPPRQVPPTTQGRTVEAPTAPRPQRPSRLILLGVGIAAVLATAMALTLVGGDSENPVSPIARAAERTAAYPGARFSFEGWAAYPELGAEMTMSGGGEFNGEEDRARVSVDASMSGAPVALPDLSTTVVMDGLTMYMSSPAFGSQLPDGASWIKVSPGEEMEEAAALGQGNPADELDALRAVSSDITEVGPERVRGVVTTHYEGTLDHQLHADLLREEGLDEAADEIEEVAEETGSMTPVDVWVDAKHRIRRLDMATGMPSEPQLGSAEMHMTMEIYDFGIKPRIDLPAAGDVFDASELGETFFEGSA